jgi:hypothetical protein
MKHLRLLRLLGFLRALRVVPLLLVLSVALHAHSHIDVGPDPADDTRLAFTGTSTETAIYVPRGEPFSLYTPRFPGGYYATELTFSAEDPYDSLARVELVSVAGPAEGALAFWEVNALSPTWSRPVGWSAAVGDRPSLITYEDGSGYGHIHGRAFTVTHPGTYTLVFRAVDDSGLRTPSANKTITLTALATPQLSIRIENGDARLSFTSRSGLTYDLQSSADLQTWTNVEAHRYIDGTGVPIELTDPLAERPRVFYRLVEYY